MTSLPDLPCRIAHIDCPRFEIAERDCAGPKYGAFPNRDTGPDPASRGDPGTGSDLDRPQDELKVRIVDIVRAGQQVRVLRYDSRSPNLHRRHAIADRSPAEHRIVA